MQWIVDDIFTFITARMPGDDLAAAGDHHFVHVALYQNLAMAIWSRHRVVAGAIAYQRERSDARRYLFASFIRRCWQRQHRCPVTFKALADRLRMPTQTPLTTLAALLSQVRVEGFPTVEMRNRHHEVATSIADQTLNLALVITLGRPSELIGEQIVALQLQEGLRLRPLFPTKDARHCDLGVVIQNARRHGAKMLECQYVALLESPGRLARKGGDEAIVGVGQIHRQKVGLLLHARDDNHCLAEVSLRLARWMHQGNEHLLTVQSLAAHIALDYAVAATEAMFVSEPLKDPLDRMTLLGWPCLVFSENRVDHAKPRIELGALDRLLALIARRHRKPQHLPNRITRNPKLASNCPLTSPIYQYRTPYAPVNIHEIHPSGVPRTLPQRQGSEKPRSGGGLLLLRRTTPLPRRSVVYFCSGAHNGFLECEPVSL